MVVSPLYATEGAPVSRVLVGVVTCHSPSISLINDSCKYFLCDFVCVQGVLGYLLDLLHEGNVNGCVGGQEVPELLMVAVPAVCAQPCVLVEAHGVER